MQLCGHLSIPWPFFGIGMKTDLFQSCGHCWVFQICWHIELSTFTASSFRIWNSLTGLPSPPLALFKVMLPKVHLTLHYMMSDSRWVTTLSWLSGSLRFFFLYSSSVFSFLLKTNISLKWYLKKQNQIIIISSFCHKCLFTLAPNMVLWTCIYGNLYYF